MFCVLTVITHGISKSTRIRSNTIVQLENFAEKGEALNSISTIFMSAIAHIFVLRKMILILLQMPCHFVTR